MRPMLKADLLIALAAAIVLIVVAPGLAWTGIIALLVLIVCGVSLAVERVRLRRR